MKQKLIYQIGQAEERAWAYHLIRGGGGGYVFFVKKDCSANNGKKIDCSARSTYGKNSLFMK